MNGFATGWRQVIAAMVIMGCSGMVAATYGIVSVPIAAEFHPSRMVLMLAITVMSVVGGIIAPFAGGWMDNRSLRWIMTIGVGGLIAGYLALSLVTSFFQVLLVFGLLLALSQTMAGPVAGAVLLTRWFDRRRGTALGIAISGIAAGSILFPPLVQFLLHHFFWRDAFRLLALILFACTVPALALIVNRPEDRGLVADGAAAASLSVETQEHAPVISAAIILADPAFWMLLIVATTVLAGMMGTVTNVVLMAVGLGIDPGKAALVVSVYAVTGFVAKLGFAAIADRVGTRLLMFVVIAVFGAGMVCLSQAASYPAILVGAGLVGVGGMMIPLQSLVLARMFGKAVMGRASGLLTTGQLCGLLVMPPVFGLIYDRTSSYSPIFLAFGAMSIVAMVLVPRIRLHPRDEAGTDTLMTASGQIAAGPNAII